MLCVGINVRTGILCYAWKYRLEKEFHAMQGYDVRWILVKKCSGKRREVQ